MEPPLQSKYKTFPSPSKDSSFSPPQPPLACFSSLRICLHFPEFYIYGIIQYALLGLASFPRSNDLKFFNVTTTISSLFFLITE